MFLKSLIGAVMKKVYVVFILVAMFSDKSYPQNWLKVDSIFSPSGVVVQNFLSPFFADLDGDGDYDLIMGHIGDRIDYFENIGDRNPPFFKKDTVMFYSIYAGGLQNTNSDYPVLIDLDNDGDLDLIIGGFNGLIYYENVGDSANAVWRKDTVMFINVNPEIGSDPRPAFGDLDGDGDFDLLVGIGESLLGGPTPGITKGFRNSGTPDSAYFTLDNLLVTNIADIGLNAYPTLADLDDDGDLDLLLGRDLQTLVYYKNNGTSASPLWQTSSTPFNVVESSTYWKNPTFCDIDGDGDLDLIYGTSGGKLYYYQNVGTKLAPSFQINNNYFKIIKNAGNASTVSLADYDNDGDYDLISGDWQGNFNYFRNDGTSSSPMFVSSSAPFTSFDPGSYSSPIFTDLDGDGDIDIVSGVLAGTLHAYINNGASFSYNSSLFSFVNVSGFSAPAFCDLDGDGDLDMLVGAENAANVKFYKNNGANVFILNDSLIAGIAFPNNSRPTFCDVDNDGDYDLIIGKSFGELDFYENIGTPQAPLWQKNNELFAGIKVKQNAFPGFADLDGDGRKDIIIGEYDGNFTFYKNLFAVVNVNNINEPAPENYALRQNYPNPFNPETSIEYELKSTDHVRIFVFDALGREITVLVDEVKSAGKYTVKFNAKNLSSGVYFYKIQAGAFVQIKKMIMLK